MIVRMTIVKHNLVKSPSNKLSFTSDSTRRYFQLIFRKGPPLRVTPSYENKHLTLKLI